MIFNKLLVQDGYQNPNQGLPLLIVGPRMKVKVILNASNFSLGCVISLSWICFLVFLAYPFE
jgi:hypothetical protein